MSSQQQVMPQPALHVPAREDSRSRAPRVLLLNDGQNGFDSLRLTLSSAGYAVHSVSTAKEALRSLQAARPDLLLVNLWVEDKDGKHLIEGLRRFTTAPIIVTSVRQEEAEKVSCLDMGADDYVTRPIATAEFLARLRAAMRRAFGVPRSEVLTAGDLKIDFSAREVFVQQARIKLTATEYDLLRALAAHAGSVKTHYQLIHELWGIPQDHNARHLLRVTVSHLRQKLLCSSSVCGHIGTELGVGYRFELE
jgi:two-component system KDP operon response regulator KdpE